MNNRSSNNNNSSSSSNNNNNNNIQSEISRSGDDYPYVVKNRTIAQSSSLGDNAGGSTGRAETKEEKKKRKKGKTEKKRKKEPNAMRNTLRLRRETVGQRKRSNGK